MLGGITMKILFVGQDIIGSRTLQRLQAFRDLGHDADMISTELPGKSYEDPPTIADRVRYRLRLPADHSNANAAVLAAVESNDYDVVWLERAVTIRAATLSRIKNIQPKCRLIWYAEDDMMNPVHLSRWTKRALPLFDLWVTTKSFNAAAAEMPSLGVRKPLFFHNSYDPKIHRAVEMTETERVEYGAAVTFVGTYEAERAASLRYIAERGIKIRVWGNGWEKMTVAPPGLIIENRAVYDDSYARVVGASDINLCFLRKDNRDLQTCRSIELPAMGGFMIHERNPEICSLLTEDVEAVYFNNNEELLKQCEKWLADDMGRHRIAEQGRLKITREGFSHHDRLRQILDACR